MPGSSGETGPENQEALADRLDAALNRYDAARDELVNLVIEARQVIGLGQDPTGEVAAILDGSIPPTIDQDTDNLLEDDMRFGPHTEDS